jgi:RNA polymerase sigma-70 factor (ECF subfamily)
MSELLDQEQQVLIQRVASGDPDALRVLYEQVGRPLYSMAFKMLSSRSEAEEVVQDVFVSVWKNASKFDNGKAKVFTWLSMLIRNRCIDRVRANKRRIPTAETQCAASERSDQKICTKTGADDLLVQERAERIRSAINRLSADQREAINMAFYLGMTRVQIAEKQGVSLGTAKSRIRYGFERLGKILSKERGWNRTNC